MSDDSEVAIAPSAPPVALTAPTPAPITYPPQGIAMTTTTARRAAPKRNAQPKAKPKRVPPRHRNAAPPPPPRPRPPTAAVPSTKKDTFVHLVETLGGAAVTSLVGALAVRWGLRPELVSAGLSGVGGYTAWASDSERNRFVGLGAASAAGSQLLLIKLNPKATATPAPQVAVRLPAPVAPPRVKNADLGTLPPGMLEAAFERARAELAVAGDGYPADYDHAYHRAP